MVRIPKKIKPDSVVKVIWHDAHSPAGEIWYTAEELQDWASVKIAILSVGMVYAHDKDYLFLVADRYSPNDHNTQSISGRPLAIPISQIQRLEVIR